MKTSSWGETVLSGYYSSSLSAKIEGRSYPCFWNFTSKPYSWSRLKWNCNHGAFHGLWWPEKVKVLCLVLCLQWKGVWLRREFFLNLCDPSFTTKTSPLTCHLADEESPQPIHTPEEVTTPFRRSRQTFQYLFIFSRQKNRQNLFFFVIEIICVPCRYFSKCRQSYRSKSITYILPMHLWPSDILY